jgi:O-antigen/teichoic acid export membrane protein
MRNQTRTQQFVLLCVAGFLANLGLNSFLAHYLTVQMYGHYALAIQVIDFLAMACLLGANASVAVLLPRYKAKASWSSMKGFLVRYTWLSVSLAFGVIVLMSVVFWVVWLRSDVNLKYFSDMHPGWMAIGLLPFFVVSMWLSRILNVFKRQAFFSFLDRVGPPLLLLVILAGVSVFDDINIYMVLLLFAVAFMVIVGVQVLALCGSFPEELKNATSRYTMNLWRKVSYPLLINNVARKGHVQIDFLMVAILLYSQKSVGIFAGILVITSVLWLSRVAVVMAYRPMLSKYYFANKLAHVETQARLAARYSLLYALPFLVVIIVFGKHLLAWYGSKSLFVPGYGVLVVVACGVYVKNAFAMVEAILQVAGLALISLRAQVVALLCAVLLNAILIPHYGIMGAAIALCITRVGVSLWQAWLVKKHVGINLLRIKGVLV